MESAAAKKRRLQRQHERGASGRVMDRASILPGYISPGNSPFLKKLPREIRDRIYGELLISRRDQEDQIQFDKIQDALNNAKAPEWQCELGLDMMAQDYMIHPGLAVKTKGAKSIRDNLGILMANKQIWDEATDVLFGKNVWGASPQWERVGAFWRCTLNCNDQPTHRPCQIRPETAVKIKHLLIIVTLPNESVKTANNVKINLTTIVDTFRECGIVGAASAHPSLKSFGKGHLLMLKVRYYCQFGGEVEAIRDEIDAPLHPNMQEKPPVMIRHSITGEFHTFEANEIGTKLFKNIKILEVLKQLRGVSDVVDVRGDLPTKYIEELTKCLSVADSGPAAKRSQRAKTAILSKQPKATGGVQEFAAEMLSKDPNMSAGMRKLCQDLMKSSTKSPAVWSQIHGGSMGPGPGRMTTPVSTPPAITAPASVAVEHGGIGIINGKPILGPPRPPSLMSHFTRTHGRLRRRGRGQSDIKVEQGQRFAHIVMCTSLAVERMRCQQKTIANERC